MIAAIAIASAIAAPCLMTAGLFWLTRQGDKAIEDIFAPEAEFSPRFILEMISTDHDNDN